MALRDMWRFLTGSKESKAPVGHVFRTDPGAISSSSSVPAFLARPPGAPAYYGFPVLDASETDGWRLGVISDPTGSTGTDYLDGFVVAPDGSRAGLIWVANENAISQVLAPTPDRWGVYKVPLPSGVNGEAELIAAFRHVLPELKSLWQNARAA